MANVPDDGAEVRSLPLRNPFASTPGEGVTCRWRCGSSCLRPPANRSGQEPFGAVLARALSRRAVLKGGLVAGLVLGAGCALDRRAPAAPRPHGLSFTAIAPNLLDDVVVPDGYAWEVLLRWGEPILPGAPEFDFAAQTARAQVGQFGYNADFLAFLPNPAGGAVLWVNHEFTDSELMLPGWNAEAPTREHVDIELAALGGSVVGLDGVDGRLRSRRGHPFNRRITAETPMTLAGPAAAAGLLKTSEDPTGTRVRGTLGNCAGGVTPWGTVLTCEEGIGGWFGNFEAVADPRIRALHDRIGFDEGPSERRWELHHPRFDLGKEPNEPFRFGWVVEIDPLDPSFVPRKRTALGRFKHEGATAKVARDGRVAFYLGDDAAFEYVYKFVTAGRLDRRRGRRARAANLGLLDAGTLYVARFDTDGSGNGIGTWLPLVHGQGGLDASKGFNSQADVLMNARAAADAVGATPMDRPEDIQASPVTGKVYVALTKNADRGAPDKPGPDAANPRAGHQGGHVLELIEDRDDATATRFTWQVFLLCGNPDDDATFFAGFPKDQVSPIAKPDNLAFHPGGALWITTDGQPSAIGFNDACHQVTVEGERRGRVEMFASAPRGAEFTGPVFTPDGATLLLSVQHPGHGGTLSEPMSDWPDRNGRPPRPSVITIRQRP